MTCLRCGQACISIWPRFRIEHIPEFRLGKAEDLTEFLRNLGGWAASTVNVGVYCSIGHVHHYRELFSTYSLLLDSLLKVQVSTPCEYSTLTVDFTVIITPYVPIVNIEFHG
jgi:hypothetical protein